MPKYEFAIKIATLNSGKSVYTPVCREKPTTRISIGNKPWQRITKIYNEYKLLELDFDPKLTKEECEEHIEGFKNQLLLSTEYQILQEAT